MDLEEFVAEHPLVEPAVCRRVWEEARGDLAAAMMRVDSLQYESDIAALETEIPVFRLLREMHPDKSDELIMAAFLETSGDVEETTNRLLVLNEAAMLDKRLSAHDPVNHLRAMFPGLLTTSEAESLFRRMDERIDDCVERLLSYSRLEISRDDLFPPQPSLQGSWASPALSNRLELGNIIAQYPDVDVKLIRRVFKDNYHNVDLTHQIIRRTLGVVPRRLDNTISSGGPWSGGAGDGEEEPDSPPTTTTTTRGGEEGADDDRETVEKEIEGIRQRLKESYSKIRTYAQSRRLDAVTHEAQRSSELRRELDAALGRFSQLQYRAHNGEPTIGEQIDLHGQLTVHAIQILKSFFEGNTRSGRTITVITGRGNHSMNGAKLYPAVGCFLKKGGFDFTSGDGHYLVRY